MKTSQKKKTTLVKNSKEQDVLGLREKPKSVVRKIAIGATIVIITLGPLAGSACAKGI